MAQQINVKSPDAKKVIQTRDDQSAELLRSYEQKLAELRSAYSAKLASINSDAADQLNKIQEKVATSDLDDAVRIRDSAAKLRESSTEVPEDKVGPATLSEKSSSSARLKRETNELRNALENAQRIIALLPMDHDFLARIKNSTYRQSNGPIWKFHADGTFEFDTKTAGRWAYFGNQVIITHTEDGQHVDLFQFVPDGSTYVVKHIGSASKVPNKLTGSRIGR